MALKKINNKNIYNTTRDKKKVLREQNHLTRPPRLEGDVKEAMMQPMRKKKKFNTQQAYDKR